MTKAWGVRSDLTPSEDTALGGRRAGSGVPGNRDLREASECEGEADRRLHLGGDAGGEDDAGVGYHCTQRMSPESPTWRANCRIVIPASPPWVYPAVEFQDGDLRTKSSMVTRRRRDVCNTLRLVFGVVLGFVECREEVSYGSSYASFI